MGYVQADSLDLLSAHGTSGVGLHPLKDTVAVENVVFGTAELNYRLTSNLNSLHTDAAGGIVFRVRGSGLSAVGVDEVVGHWNTSKMLVDASLMILVSFCYVATQAEDYATDKTYKTAQNEAYADGR